MSGAALLDGPRGEHPRLLTAHDALVRRHFIAEFAWLRSRRRWEYFDWLGRAVEGVGINRWWRGVNGAL